MRATVVVAVVLSPCCIGFAPPLRSLPHKLSARAAPSKACTGRVARRAGCSMGTEPWTIVEEGSKSTLTVHVAGQELIFETGRIGRQAHGAILSRDGDTMLYTTACADSSSGLLDFVPLKIDYQERFSSAGMTSGG
eukprot:17485-Heterococcus_DN1.PRE.3